MIDSLNFPCDILYSLSLFRFKLQNDEAKGKSLIASNE